VLQISRKLKRARPGRAVSGIFTNTSSYVCSTPLPANRLSVDSVQSQQKRRRLQPRPGFTKHRVPHSNIQTWDEEKESPKPPPYSGSRAQFYLEKEKLPDTLQSVTQSPDETRSSSPSNVEWEYHDLVDYNNLDLDKENLASRYTQSISLSLKDFFIGKHLRYRFSRKSRSGSRSEHMMTVVIPPGCPSNTVFCFENVGHQLASGAFQDIYLIFTEAASDDGMGFERHGSNLSVRVRLPWTDRLNEGPCRFTITGIGGEKYSLEVDYCERRMVNGTAIFRGAGMPRCDGKGRGSLAIESVLHSPLRNLLLT